MEIGWLVILPVVLLTITLACFLIYYIAKNNERNSHKKIDPKPSLQTNEPLKKED